MNKRVFFFACLFIIFSCEKGEDVVVPDRIYSTYELIYDLNENKTTAKAKLTLDGPEGELVKIKSPAEITFNKDPLVLNIKRTYNAYMNSGTATGGRMSTTYRQEEFILFKNN